MNKNKLVLAAVGGSVALIVLVLAVFVYLAWSGKVAAIEGDEESDGLETVVAKAQSLSRKSVYPSAASVAAVDANARALSDWQAEAYRLASHGDKVFEATTPAAFKTFLVADAKRLSHLPGAVDGVLMKPDFAFGPFREYIVEGKMPADAQLADLQCKWDDIATVVEMLSANGCCELTDVQFKAMAAESAEAEKKNAKKPAKAKKNSAKGKAAAEIREPAARGYVFTFTTKAPGLVKLSNALATCERFIVVDDLAFHRGKDAIATALGGDEKKEAAQQGGRRRGRRLQAAAQEEKKEDAAAQAGIVTDPQLDDPFVVTLTLTVYDFRSLEAGEKTEEVKE